jgi:hypothetical protein
MDIPDPLDARRIIFEPQHAARGSGYAINAASKMGQGILISHPRLALEDPSGRAIYGMIYGHFKRYRRPRTRSNQLDTQGMEFLEAREDGIGAAEEEEEGELHVRPRVDKV